MHSNTFKHDEQTLFQGDWLTFKKRGQFEFVSRVGCQGVVVIVAVTDAREIVLVEQYRAAVDAQVLELPAGLVGDLKDQASESYESAAKRELLEETGYEAQEMKPLLEGPISSGLASECMKFYLAHALLWRHAGGGDATENIRVHKVRLEDAEAYLQQQSSQGMLIDPKIYIGLYCAAQHGVG